jgi:hypothetical protein
MWTSPRVEDVATGAEWALSARDDEIRLYARSFPGWFAFVGELAIFLGGSVLLLVEVALHPPRLPWGLLIVLGFWLLWTSLGVWVLLRSFREVREPPYLYARLDREGFDTAVGRFTWNDVLSISRKDGGDGPDWLQIELRRETVPLPPSPELRAARRRPYYSNQILSLPAPNSERWGPGNIDAFRHFHPGSVKKT